MKDASRPAPAAPAPEQQTPEQSTRSLVAEALQTLRRAQLALTLPPGVVR